MTLDPTQQNQFLHLILKEKCTEDTLETVCDIITAVKGNPKMKALGESMKRRLETGGYKCVWGPKPLTKLSCHRTQTVVCNTSVYVYNYACH